MEQEKTEEESAESEESDLGGESDLTYYEG